MEYELLVVNVLSEPVTLARVAVLGNNVIIKISPNVFALDAHVRRSSLMVKAGDAVKAGAPLARLGNSSPSKGPHLHFGVLDRPDPVGGIQDFP